MQFHKQLPHQGNGFSPAMILLSRQGRAAKAQPPENRAASWWLYYVARCAEGKMLSLSAVGGR